MKASELRKKFRNEYRERNVLKRVGGLVKIISDLIKNRSSDAVVIREGKDITVVSYGEHFYQDRRVKDLQDYCMTHFIGGRGTEGLTETIQEELNKFPLSVLLVVSVEMLNRHGDYEILFHSYSSQQGMMMNTKVVVIDGVSVQFSEDRIFENVNHGHVTFTDGSWCNVHLDEISLVGQGFIALVYKGDVYGGNDKSLSIRH